MSKPDKKQRHKKKREAKRIAARKLNSISPIKRLGMANGNFQCWISSELLLHGQLQILIYKQAAGLSGIASFLIDRGVVGLKDAWFQMGVSSADMEDKLEMCRQRNIEMRKCSVEETRKWIAGGVRWAHDNKMRLPTDWVKCASIIGGVGDWHSADVSAFVMEFAGHPEDLRRRLIGEPFDDYIQRTDVAFVFSNDAPYLGQSSDDFFDEDDFDDEVTDAFDDDTDLLNEQMDALGEKIARNVELLTQHTSAWLRTRNEAASSELYYAWECVFMANAFTNLAAAGQPQAEMDQKKNELIEEMSKRLESRLRAEFSRGVTQVMQHLVEEPELISHALALPEPFVEQAE